MLTSEDTNQNMPATSALDATTDKHSREAELARRLERAIADAETDRESLRRLNERIDNGLWDFEVSADHQWYSRRFIDMLEFANPDPCDHLLWAIRDLIHPEDSAQRDAFDAFLRDGNELDIEVRLNIGPTGNRWIRFRGGALRGTPGDALLISGSLEDIDDRKRLEQDRDAIARRLRQSNAALAEFARVASHDLCAPMRNIRQLASWIREDCAETIVPEARVHLDNLDERVRRMEKMLTDMLAYARIDPGTSQNELVDLSVWANAVVDAIAPLESSAISVEAPSERRCLPVAPLRLCLQNLVDNALKHTAPGTRIHVRLTLPDGCLEIEVRDEGEGIRPADQAKVFEIFQRARASATTEGAGLGLAMVKRTVEAAAGCITLDSAPGHGATFRIRWPLH